MKLATTVRKYAVTGKSPIVQSLYDNNLGGGGGLSSGCPLVLANLVEMGSI